MLPPSGSPAQVSAVNRPENVARPERSPATISRDAPMPVIGSSLGDVAIEMPDGPSLPIVRYRASAGSPGSGDSRRCDSRPGDSRPEAAGAGVGVSILGV